MTVLGGVRYRRAYYRCRDCGAVHYAGDETLGVAGDVFTVPAQEAISLVSSEVPFERARVLLQRLSGVTCCVSQAERLTQTHGQRLQQQPAQACAQLFAGAAEAAPEQRDHRLYVALDATKTRFCDDWHETRGGAIYDAQPDDQGRDEPQRTTTVACAWQDLETFGQRLYQEAARRGVAHAREAQRKASGYFATNRQRMAYPAYRARGLHLGSGVGEAACKAVVATRCKRSGSRWSQPGAQAVLTLRTQLLNNRWDEYWQPLKISA